MNRIARLGCVAVIAGILGWGVTAPARADTDNFGQKVYMCAHMMLPYDLNADGSITMIMADGTVMHFRTFGSMVTYMRLNSMCS